MHVNRFTSLFVWAFARFGNESSEFLSLSNLALQLSAHGLKLGLRTIRQTYVYSQSSSQIIVLGHEF
jgi:hypothetical protein